MSWEFSVGLFWEHVFWLNKFYGTILFLYSLSNYDDDDDDNDNAKKKTIGFMSKTTITIFCTFL